MIPREKMELLRKLLARTMERGCTPAEAAAASAAAAKILTDYQLDIANITVDEQVIANESLVKQDTILDKGKKRINHSRLIVANYVALGMDCKLLVLPMVENGTKLVVHGHESDVVFTIWLIETLIPHLEILADTEAFQRGLVGGQVVNWRHEFLRSAAPIIQKRLMQARKGEDDADPQVPEGVSYFSEKDPKRSRALVVLSQHKQEVVDRYYQKENPKVRSMNWSRTSYNSEARDRGRVAGQNAPIHKPLSNTKPERLPHK